ncbi:MAG TPA: nucleotidyltransferase [Kofleriaceae bacterium]|nr:nucleotidyltransferase [Kofleriaceae bacterium]
MGQQAGFVEEDLRGADDLIFAGVLGEAVDALEDALVSYALIGGIASSGFGRPRWTHDIDLFVKAEDADRALDALAARGFKTERTDVQWIFKAFKNKVMVDVIFRSTGGFHLDQDMLDRSVRGQLMGHEVRFIPPEDLLIMKAVVHDEAGPRHWHDALGIIAGAELDWEYLQRRALKAPRRVLSLLVYAHSLDLTVPNRVIRGLFGQIYES